MGVGKRRRGGHRRAHRAHHHHRHNRPNRRRRHPHRHHIRGHFGHTPRYRFRRRVGGGGVAGGAGAPVTSGYVAMLIVLTMFGIFGFFMGMVMANIGGWTGSSLGIVGMVILFIGIAFITVVVLIRCNMERLPDPAGAAEAGSAVTVSAASLGSTVASSNVGETTSYIIQTGSVQPGGVAMGSQPGYHVGPTQPYPGPPVQGYPPVGIVYPPAPPGATQYPPTVNQPPTPYGHTTPMPYTQPQSGQGSAPPGTYTYPVQPPPPTTNHMGVTDVETNNDAPPPTYNDVMSGNVKYDEGNEHR